MKQVKNIPGKYRWDAIGVWSAILAGSFAILFLAVSSFVAGCNRILGQKSDGTEDKTVVVAAKPFTLPTIPVALTQPADRVAYLAVH